MPRRRCAAAVRLGAIPLVLAGLALLLATPQAQARKKQAEPPAAREALPTIAEKTRGLEARRGFFTFYFDDREGRIWLEMPPPAGERGEAARLIYVDGLLSGLGSNPVGLDRGQISDAKLLVVRRLGPRVLAGPVGARR